MSTNLSISRKTTIEDLLNFKKDDLKAYLRDKKEKISGSKLELATRIIGLQINQEKFQEDHNVCTPLATAILPTDYDVPNYDDMKAGWTSDMSNLPKLSISDIEKYLINSRADDCKKMECYRQYIRGLNFYKEKYIHKIMYNPISENQDLCYIRSKCFPSMKQGIYQQWILLSKAHPIRIIKAHCTCPAGLGEACTHIAGLLFAVEGCCQINDDTACTSKPCEWNKPSKRKKDPKPVDEIKFKKIKLNDIINEQNDLKFKEKTSSDKLQTDFRNKLCSKLENCNAVIFHLAPLHVNTIPVESDLNVAQEVEVETTSVIEYESDKYVDIGNIITENKENNLDLSCSETVANEIEQRTKGQGENEMWVRCRAGRITASVFHDVYKRKDNTKPDKLVNKILGKSETETSNIPSIQWGKKFEKVAKKNIKHIKS